MNLFDLLSAHPLSDDEPLVHTIDQSFTKREVLAAVDTKAAEIELTAGSALPVVADGVDALVAMFACWQAEVVFVPINPRQPQTAIDHATRATSGPMDTGTAFVTWTSGTTGQPKPVLHTHTGYLEIIDRVLEPLRGKKPGTEKRSPSPNLIPVSMVLNAGIYNALFGLRAGAPLVLMDGFDTATFATLVDRHQIRSTVLPPAAMAMLSDDLAVTSLAPLRYVRSITAPLSPFQARRFNSRFGVTVLNGYGQAEIGEVIGWTAADAKTHPDKIGAIGLPHPGVEIRIDEPDENSFGELLVKPPNTAVGLEPGRLTSDGYVRTGDLARIDDDGFVWIEGRLGDLINRGGNKVFPGDVEEVLLAIPGVRECAVVGVPDDRLGEVPVAFVVGDFETDLNDTDLIEPDLEAECRTHLVAYKVPVRFERIDALPRSEVGKVLRTKLAESL